VKRIPLTIDNRLRLRLDDLDPETLTDLQREFTHRNPQKAKLEKQAEGAKYNRAKPWLKFALAKSAANEPATIPTWHIDGDVVSFPRGGKDRLQAMLEDRDYFVDAFDHRVNGTLPCPNARYTGTLWDFQQRMVEEGMRVEEGIARSPTGSGKTEAVIGLVCEANLPSLVIVNEQGLLDQWIRRMRQSTNITDIGIIGDGKFNPRPITIGMQQTLKRRIAEVRGYFGFVACDEAHLFAADTFLEVVDQLPARYRVGFTADEHRKDGKEFLLYDTLGPVFAEVKEKKLIDEGYILDVEVRLVPTDFERDWWNELHPQARGMEMDRLIHEMAEDPERNRLAVQIALWAAREEGQQVLVMAHHTAHCRRLLADIAASNPRVGLLIGEDKDAYVRGIAGMMQGSVQIGVGTYKKMGTGIDLKRLSRGVAVTPVHLNKFFMKQLRGRYCRTADGKGDAVIYVLWDREIFGFAPAENFKRWAPKVSVRDDGGWIDVREYLKREKAER
jgi:superfamily II DNA or RNA helicase